jgi:hypothetical protein
MDGLCDSEGLRETDGAEDGLDETDADGFDETNGCNKTDEAVRACLPFLCSITTTIASIGTFSCLANEPWQHWQIFLHSHIVP